MFNPRVAVAVGAGLVSLITFFIQWNRQRQRQRQIPHGHRTGHPADTEERIVPRCPVCTRPILHDDFRLQCNDTYHRECLAEVFSTEVVDRRSCPKCRQIVPEGIVQLCFINATG